MRFKNQPMGLLGSAFRSPRAASNPYQTPNFMQQPQAQSPLESLYGPQQSGGFGTGFGQQTGSMPLGGMTPMLGQQGPMSTSPWAPNGGFNLDFSKMYPQINQPTFNQPMMNRPQQNPMALTNFQQLLNRLGRR